MLRAGTTTTCPGVHRGSPDFPGFVIRCVPQAHVVPARNYGAPGGWAQCRWHTGGPSVAREVVAPAVIGDETDAS